MGKQNCWEFKECGREPGGKEVSQLGECPAAKMGEGDGINDGECRGRVCWAISGTFCGGKIQGSFAQKQDSCLDCDFFNKVEKEEGDEFHLLLPKQTYVIGRNNDTKKITPK
jgi:hypothetical protein